MARIVVTTAGTLGDFVPFLGLARHLQARGHNVSLAVNAAMIPLAEKTGLPAIPCGTPFGPEDAQRQSDIFEGPLVLTTDQVRGHLRRLDLERLYRDLAGACRGADLLISSSLQGVAGWIHEATGIPWFNGTIFPMEFRQAGEPHPESGPATGVLRELFDYRNGVRANLGLPAVPDSRWKARYWSDRLVLVACSPHFSQPSLDELPHAHMTGFWFDDRAAPDETGDPRLDRFLEAGEPPLVLTLSSQVVKDAARVTALHATAATRLGLRLIVQKGWAGLGPEALPGSVDPARVYFAEHVPHAALFPRVAAVIHHGGIGTTAQALRCGRPMLIEPYCNDQFFNARRIEALGVGGAADPLGLTVETLTQTLERVVLTGEARQRAEQLAPKIQSEKGLELACDLIEQKIAG